MPPNRRTDKNVLGAIELLALTTSKTAGAVYTELKSRDDLAGLKFSLKTVERVVKDIRPPQDDSDIWTLADSEGGDARKILNVLREVIWSSNQQINHFTKDEAWWILKISKAAPGLDGARVWLLAKLYQRRLTNQRLDTEDLDAFLAFMPWIGSDDIEIYEQEISKGLKPVPMRDWLIQQGSHYLQDGDLFPGWPRARPWPEAIEDAE